MKKNSFTLWCVACTAALAFPISAAAAIDMLPKDVTLKRTVTWVQVVNNGDRAEYVNVSLSRLMNPGVPFESERLEPVGDIDQPSIYASPFRLSLAPGQTKSIAIKVLRPVDTETVYRLDVRPVIKVLSAAHAKQSASVVANLAFSGIVRQMPSKTRAALAVACEASGARLTATGNVHYRVEDAKADGQSLDAFNVYPGVPLPVPGAHRRYSRPFRVRRGSREVTSLLTDDASAVFAGGVQPCTVVAVDIHVDASDNDSSLHPPGQHLTPPTGFLCL
ncbi:hypothetical protein AAB992_07140 [Burkholderia contaminans]|uniref:hypothetical protein n=1 Tax=Burkholderia contaminans TaxID=488447 RepID=UPI002416F9B7|nr:hypothetical protein [Burkholderia contaminans]WFN13190.1 hypothetical protein LXE92_19695 [Burkholderia contaminans]